MVVAAGNGLPGGASFADSLWGAGSREAEESRALGLANPLLGFAEGGTYAAFGTQLSAHTRLAVTMLDSAAGSDRLGFSSGLAETLVAGSKSLEPVARGFGLGLTTRLAQGWTGGLSLDYLHEQNGLLGTTYDGGGALGLGGDHGSLSLGVSSAVALGENAGLLFDLSLARSDGAAIADGLVTSVTPTLARAYGIAFVDRNLLKDGDHLTLGLKRPLTVIAGAANLSTASVDSEGNAVLGTTRVSLAPQAGETDLVLGYSTPWQYGIGLSADLSLRRDHDNIAGNNDALAMVGAKLAF
jgi:hypothetical protein